MLLRLNKCLMLVCDLINLPKKVAMLQPITVLMRKKSDVVVLTNSCGRTDDSAYGSMNGLLFAWRWNWIELIRS